MISPKPIWPTHKWQEPTDTGIYDTILTVRLPFRVRKDVSWTLSREFQRMLTLLGLDSTEHPVTYTIGDADCRCEPGEHISRRTPTDI